MPDDNQTVSAPATPAATPATPAAADSSPLSIQDFAAKIRKRDPRLTPQLVDDATLVRKVLERKPELTKYVQSSEPRRKLRDRIPSPDQRMQKFFENHPLLREAALGASSGLGVPESTSPVTDMARGMYHTVADEAKTEDEKAFFAILPLYRVIKGIVQQTHGYGQEMYDAVDWKKFVEEAKSGKGGKNIFDLYLNKDESGRKVGAEHLVHGAAGLATMIVSALTGSKKVPKAAEAASKAVEGVGETLTVTGQRAAGAGPLLAERTAKGAVEDVTKHNVGELDRHATATDKHAAATETVQDKNTAAEADYHTKVDRINQDFDQKIAEVKEKHAGDIALRDEKVAKLQGEHAEKVGQARGEWVRKAHEARQAERNAAKLEGKREELQHTQKAYTKLVDENVKKTHGAVRGSLDGRYDAVRNAVGEETPLNTESISKAVQEGRKTLQGAPADLKVFNDLIQQIDKDPETGGMSVIDSEAIEDRPEGGTDPSRQLTWSEGRTHYSAIGDKMFSGELPHNVFKALETVRKVIDGELESAAIESVTKKAAEKGGSAAGAKAGAAMKREYGQLKQDWAQYESDWRDMSSQATGGSPLSRMLKAVDDPIVMAQVLSKYGDRLMQTFARYEKFGASPTLMSKLRDYAAVLKSLPKPKAPTGLETRVYNAPGSAGIRVPERPALPTTPGEPPPVPPVEPKVADIEADRAKRIERTPVPEPKPLPEPPPPPDLKAMPTIDEMKQKLKEAKVEKAKEAKEKSLTWTKYDTVLGGLSLLGPFIGHNIAYAIPYTVARFGEMALVSSKFGQEWLSKITSQDVQAMNAVLTDAGERTAVQQAVTKGLIEKARKGERLPALKMFDGFLDKASLASILRVVSPPQQQTTAAPAAPAPVQ